MARRLTRKSSYHHGDLRRALLEAGLRVLREEGAQALNLRAVARRAGVSHAAPYRHFESKEQLLAAIAEQGFVALRESMEQSAGRARSPRERLARIGRGYVRFAVAHPEHAELMFRPGCFEANYAPLREAADAAFAILVDAVAAAQAAGELRRDNPRAIAWTQWSLVHGLSTLLAQGALEKLGASARAADDAARLALDLLQEGLAAR